jgi:anhydro-N-acetylmuramic acid kinase
VRALRPGQRYDEGGVLARAGTPIAGVVDALLQDAYFAASPPKTTGREHFGAAYAIAFLARCRSAAPQASDADIVATAVSLTALSVADAYRRFVAEPVSEVLLSGGGARNPVLVDALTRALAPRVVRLFDDVYFDGEAKEAVAFALLAALHLAGKAGNVPGATGAHGPRVLGKFTPAGKTGR